MELSKNYQPQENENKWYAHWKDKGYFYSTPDERPAYTIVMPPPNVTGVLHMGHALNNSVQDVLIRRAKMQGFNTCWVPGTDHASIATEAKVVAMLQEQGIDKNSLSRDEFLKYAWEWKEKYGGIILSQLQKLGCSLDWNRVNFTMDDHYYTAVINVFVDLYKKGHIYRGAKMINWDPQAKTALSDEEVIHKDTNSKLTYVQYQVEGTDEYITIATVRPETILGDTAICVHPEDPRYAHLRGKFAIVPLVNRRIPIIFDDYIDIEFGTGALKVTPAHDINDYNLGKKHNLEVIDILDETGKLNATAQLYVGEDRFTVRKKIVEDLKAAGNFVKQEDYKNQVGYSERTNAVVEPRLSMQWWCNMETLVQPALEAVETDDIAFVPSKFKNLYRHWMTNIKDWCISRQLRWGHRIPAWYDREGNIYVGATETEALAQYQAKNPTGTIADLTQENDVLDTWFSSWLWPLEVFGWDANKENNAELDYYYPTQTLVTAPEIIFFWVARMIMAGYEYKNQLPFQNVYFTGIVRDKLGRKMSKSLGNSPDLLKLIDDYGADAVRFGVMISSPAGNDILFDESALEQGRNFSNKMWNALKLIKIWEENPNGTITPTDANQSYFAITWMKERIKEVSAEIEQLFKDFRLSEALKTIYSLIWDDFCSWYLEWAKPAYGAATNSVILEETKTIFEALLQLLHPYMPFVTEEIFHNLKAQSMDLMVTQLPAYEAANKEVLAQGALLKQIITAIREVRAKNQLKQKETLEVFINTNTPNFYFDGSELNNAGQILQGQVNATTVQLTQENVANSFAIVVNTEKLYIVCNVEVDTAAQIEKMEEELNYLKGFLISVEKKLSNERFVANAKPEIVANEVKKKDDAIAKIKTLEESLASLS